MNESTRDLINIQELFESAGPQIFLPNFDTQSYLASSEIVKRTSD